MAFIRCELEDDPGTALFVINGFDYDFRIGDILSYSGVGEAYVDYKVESVKVQVNKVDATQEGGAETASVWGAAVILVTVSVVPPPP